MELFACVVGVGAITEPLESEPGANPVRGDHRQPGPEPLGFGTGARRGVEQLRGGATPQPVGTDEGLEIDRGNDGALAVQRGRQVAQRRVGAIRSVHRGNRRGEGGRGSASVSSRAGGYRFAHTEKLAYIIRINTKKRRNNKVDDANPCTASRLRSILATVTLTLTLAIAAVGCSANPADDTPADRLVGPAYDPGRWARVARSSNDRGVGASVLYAPAAVWTVLPSKGVVEGISEAYRFTVRRPDGGTLVIERAIELPAVPPGYADWFTAQRTDVMRRVQPDWQWTANAVPAQEPAFNAFTGDRHGRLWVSRSLGTETVSECDADPLGVVGRRAVACWRDESGYDVFNEVTGRLLGEVLLPDGRLHVFLGNTVLMVQENEVGTIMVKRYRLVLPGEGR